MQNIPEYGEIQVWEIQYSRIFYKISFLKQILIINRSKIVKRHVILLFGSNSSTNKKMKDKEYLKVLSNLVLITLFSILISLKIISMKKVELLYRLFIVAIFTLVVKLLSYSLIFWNIYIIFVPGTSHYINKGIWTVISLIVSALDFTCIYFLVNNISF